MGIHVKCVNRLSISVSLNKTQLSIQYVVILHSFANSVCLRVLKSRRHDMWSILCSYLCIILNISLFHIHYIYLLALRMQYDTITTFFWILKLLPNGPNQSTKLMVNDDMHLIQILMIVQIKIFLNLNNKKRKKRIDGDRDQSSY